MKTRNKFIRLTANDDEMAEIDAWTEKNGLSKHGRSSALRLMAKMVTDKDLKPTRAQVEASIPRKLEKQT